MRKGKALPTALTSFLQGRGVDASVVLAVVGATRGAVKDSRASW